jgi:hypothetical protein
MNDETSSETPELQKQRFSDAAAGVARQEPDGPSQGEALAKLAPLSGIARPTLATSAAVVAAKAVAELLLARGPIISLAPLSFDRKREPPTKSLEERKSELVRQLLASGIDPMLFDALLSNEIDRRLKTRFGIAFVALTAVFTAASYAIIILNGMLQWGISEIAITGLIIETPIQFIGLLYIIARNLFPDGGRSQLRIPMGVPTAHASRGSDKHASSENAKLADSS